MVIAHNISATNTYNKMGISSSAADKSMEKLSSGYKINRAADDAAGLSISEKMRSQIRGLNQASENAENGISMIQTAEGALNEAHSILQRMRELAVQSANDTNAASDREALQSEINQLTSEINRIGNTTEFNGMKLLNGSKIKTTGKEEIEVANSDGTTFNNFTSSPGVVNTAKLKFTQNITLGTTDNSVNYDELQAADGANVITIGKKDGKLTCSIELHECKAKTADDGKLASLTDSVSFTDEFLTQDTNGDWVYNNHGISFKVDKDSAQAFITNGDDTDVTKIDLFKAAGADATDYCVKATAHGTFGVTNDYNEGTSKNIKIKDNTFRLAKYGTNDQRGDYDKVEIVYQNASTTAQASLKVTLYNGQDVITETIGQAGVTAAGNIISYNAHGLEFTIEATNTIGASDKMSITVDLDDLYKTEKVQGTGTGTDNSVYFHVGANTNQVINTTFGDMRASTLGLTGTGKQFTEEFTVNNGTDSTSTERGLNISTRQGANDAIDIIDKAITKVSEERSKYGAIQNRLEYTINNLDTTSENMTSAESTIRDVDMASEMMELTKNQILQQASQAMLSQAMQTPQQVLQLLQ